MQRVEERVQMEKENKQKALHSKDPTNQLLGKIASMINNQNMSCMQMEITL